MLFGAREASATAHRRGLLVAVALESVVKLAALIGCAAGPGARQERLAGSAGARVAADGVVARAIWRSPFTQTRPFAACAIFCLPRQFQVGVVEASILPILKLARRVFIGYLVLVSICVLPVAWLAQDLVLAGTPITCCCAWP